MFGRQGVELKDFGDVLNPGEAQEPILARPVRAALLEWLTEIWASDDLKAVGLRPRHRALFHGAPGTGKTTLAHHLSARLGLPMVAVRPDRVIDKWVGSSGRNLGALFDAARSGPEGQGPVVLFFDEFEALGAKRRAEQQGADQERNATMDVLLQRIEAHDGIIIAATNHADWLDAALWRRFDLHIQVDAPGQEERERILARYLAPFGLPSEALSALAHACETASPALLRQLCEGLKRNIVIGPKVGWNMNREATLERVLAAVEPHPDLGRPRLWSQGRNDRAVPLLPWPLPRADEVREGDADARMVAPPAPTAVVKFPGGKHA